MLIIGGVSEKSVEKIMCKSNFAKIQSAMSGCICVVVITMVYLLSALDLHAQCGTGLGGTIGLSDTNGQPIDSSTPVHIGDVIKVSLLEVQNQQSSYRATGLVANVFFPNGTSQQTMIIPTLKAGSSCDPANGGLQGLHCPGATGIGTLPAGAQCVPFADTYVVTFQGVTNQSLLTCIGTTKPTGFIIFKQIAVGTALTAAGTVAGNATACQDISVPVIFPCITVTKECDYPVGTSCFPYGAPIKFKGTVCNTGDSTLSNVQVTDTPSGGSSVVVTNILTLAPGQCVNYSGSYSPTGSLCGPFTDTISATALDITQRPISNTDPCINSSTGASTGTRPAVTATCNVCSTPCISVTKNCSPAVNPGSLQTISGVVTNCGNVPLTNIVVTDNILGAVTNIALLNTNSSVAYSLSFTANCNGNTNIVTARGTSVCGGSVTNTATAACLVTSTTAIVVSKNCSPSPVIPGVSQTISGSVSNAGSITLTNIIVTDNILGAVTNIASLAPGAVTNYSLTFIAGCNGNTNIVTARATSICGVSVTNTATAACLVAFAPNVSISKICPLTPPALGGTLVFTVTVTNTGNIGLTNIVISNQLAGASAVLLTNINIASPGLLPNSGLTFTGSESVPSALANCLLTNTVTAAARTVCAI